MGKQCENETCDQTYERGRSQAYAAFEKQKYCSKDCADEVRKGHLVEDVAWIVDHDHPESVAKRVGYGSATGLVNKLRKLGEVELADKLAGNIERYTKGSLAYREDVFA